MTEETGINNLKSLGQSWAQKVKGIRRMAKNDDASRRDEGVAPPPSTEDSAEVLEDKELFVDLTGQELSTQDIFSEDENFDLSIKTPSAAPGDSSSRFSAPTAAPKRSISISKVFIGILFLAVLAGLSYWVFLNRTSLLALAKPSVAEARGVVSVDEQLDSQPAAQPYRFPLDPDSPVSLEAGRDYFRKAEYPKACAVYERLIHGLPRTDATDALRDYLQLNMALCLQEINDDGYAAELLKQVSLSSSPLVRAYANYYLCLFERNRKQFLVERTRAYRAVGLLDVVDVPSDWRRALQRDLYFLIAEAITRQALSLADADRDLPKTLWPSFNRNRIPLADFREPELSRMLNAGSQEWNAALIAPQIRKYGTDGTGWKVISNAASIGELMGRISSNINRDILWQTDSGKRARNNPVSLCFTVGNVRDMVTVAAGAVGLAAVENEDDAFVLCNPAEYSSVSDQISFLAKEAISCWQNYLSKFEEDRYLANVYFALGMLKAEQGQVVEAISAYKMVSSRYSNSPLGPYALSCSSKLKDSLHDYQGAYEDLKEAVEQYPDHEGIEQTYLVLAAAAEKINHPREAAKLYCKVYYLNNSPTSRSNAAFAAGRLFFDNQNYDDAEKWLTAYINLNTDSNDGNLHQACLFLGKLWSIQNKPEAACEALQAALQGPLSPQDYVEAMTALVENYIVRECFVEALSILNDASARQLSQAESVQILLLKSSVLRTVGLTDKAITLLSEKEAYIIDEELKNQIRYERSECYIEQNQLDLAYRELANILEKTGYTSFGYKVACRLTDVCSQLGMDAEAMKISAELLNTDPPAPIKHKALALLAMIYNKQNNYDRAALVLMGQWK